MLQQLRQLLRTPVPREPRPVATPESVVHAKLGEDLLRIVGRALAIRHVDAGSCNACELELHALSNPYYNLEGLGMRFVASPRHADVLLATGPVSRNMAIALRRTYDAMPDPRIVIAAGTCACTGGIFGESYASVGRVANVIPVDVEIVGCPPSPLELLQGLLAAVSVAAPRAPGADAATVSASAGTAAPTRD
jgi:Ni,Fe-hydrogenase III small subunit